MDIIQDTLSGGSDSSQVIIDMLTL